MMSTLVHSVELPASWLRLIEVPQIRELANR
jgi:hypothetical protein